VLAYTGKWGGGMGGQREVVVCKVRELGLGDVSLVCLLKVGRVEKKGLLGSLLTCGTRCDELGKRLGRLCKPKLALAR